MTSSPIAGILSSSILATSADGGSSSGSSSSNETNPVLQLQTNHSGVSFILILDGCVFVLGLLILFCCLRNLRLWKRKKSPSSNSSINTSSNTNNNSNNSNNERNVFKRFFKRIYQFLINESEYERIGKLYGHEVSVYLWYSHQMILFTGLFTLIGLSVLLPLHLTGQISNSNTMNNLNVISKNQNSTNIETDSFLYKTSVNMVLSLTDRLYAHVILFYLFSILIFYLMYRFINSKFVNQYINMDGYENDSNSTLNMISNYSVLLKDIPIHITDNNIFRKSVESIFPNLNIYSCRLIHDTSERIELQESFENSIEQIKHYEYVKNQTNKHVKLIKLFESSKNGKCCSKIIERVDALNYWNEKKLKLEELIQEWEENFKNHPKSTGYGHVIFKSIQDASKCKSMDETGLKLFKLNGINNSDSNTSPIINNTTNSTTTNTTNNNINGNDNDEKIIEFRIEKKTFEPQDLNWSNFSLSKSQRTFRVAIVNILLIVLLLFFTSPLAIVSSIQSIANRIPEAAKVFNSIKEASGYTGDILFHYLPTLLLFIIAQLLPMIIPLLTRFEKYKSYSEESSVYLLRLFIYVVLSTLILPVLLLTSLDGVIRYFEQFSNSVTGSSDSNWQALFDYLFLPQSGAFFINYTIQYSLLGCFVDMIRLKDLIIYFYLRFKSVTEEEKENATKISEFDLPLEYGYMIAFFGIILTFSVFVPLILPIGFFYFIVKHLIDRYNISRLCSKNDKARYKLSPDITSYRERNKLIVQMTFFCIIFSQFYVMLFFAKSGDVTFIHLFLMCLLLILSIVYALYWNINYKTKFNPLDSNNNQLIHSTFYSQDEELSIFNNQLQDKFSYAYFPPFALESINGLNEQREQEINNMKLTI